MQTQSLPFTSQDLHTAIPFMGRLHECLVILFSKMKKTKQTKKTRNKHIYTKQDVNEPIHIETQLRSS